MSEIVSQDVEIKVIPAAPKENKNPIVAVWNYIKEMNSEKGGGISIKRNMSWGIGTLLFVVECYSLVKVPMRNENEIGMYIKMCEFYAVLDAAFVALALGITSIEKLSEAATKFRYMLSGGKAPAEEPKEVKPEPTPAIIVNANVEQTS